MTEEQRRQRAVFICEQPVLWLFLLYAVCFLGSTVASDILSLAGVAPLHRGSLYILSFVVALSLWRMQRRWAQQLVASPLKAEERLENS